MSNTTPFTVAPCVRCEQPCFIRTGERQVDYPLAVLKPATGAGGLCAECAAHWWLFTVDGIRWALEDSGADVLRMPMVRTLLASVLAQMHPELGMLDWARLITNWDLPWPADWTLAKDSKVTK